ncbi:MAG: hypothetical protein WCU80_00760 [Paludibacteraceae bacterium]|nr:hypothetical protein [Prevotellaceae bacterium]
MKLRTILLTACLSLFSVSFLSCYDEEAKDEYYEKDPMDWDLPVYTESGLNLFGAQYTVNDVLFYVRSSADTVPCRMVAGDGTLKIYMTGKRYKSDFSICFDLKVSQNISSYADLSVLEGDEFFITSDSCDMKIYKSGEYMSVEPWSGSLRINNAKTLYVDNKLSGAIFSGTFGMELKLRNDTIDISYGRFDFLIDDANFSLE